jgi:hypothetical protein
MDGSTSKKVSSALQCTININSPCILLKIVSASFKTSLHDHFSNQPNLDYLLALAPVPTHDQPSLTFVAPALIKL